MKERGSVIEISGIEMEIVRKRVKHLRVTILPPDGRVRVSVPLTVGHSEVQRFILDHLDWIGKHREKWAERFRRSLLVSGDSAQRLFLGKAYPLHIGDHTGRARVSFSPETGFDIRLPAGGAKDHVDVLLEAWYRARLREIMEPLVEKWRVRLDVDVREWSLRRMKTRWGSCNVISHRVWFSLELAKKTPECHEYLVVHELAHLIERGHGSRFKALLDKHLPDWKVRRAALVSGGVA
ncbi:MAG: SprT family zinc-dependent metalloprotease [Treponemataceae bacterium]